MNNSGIYSLAGFAYQIKVFVYYLTQLQDNCALGFETYDDVALQRTDDSVMQEGKLHTYNGIFNLPSGITALQVKRTALSSDDYEKVLFNWIILNNSSSNVEKFVLLVDKSYGNSDSVFPTNFRSLYNKIVNSSSNRNALITQVKEIINNDYKLFTQLCKSIKKRYSFKEIDDIDNEIFESYKPIFHHGGVKEVTYKLRIRDLAEKIDRSTNTISNWEMEKATPDADVLEKLCQVFGVTPNQLYGWESCKELEDFVNEKKELMLQLENLQREKLEIDARIKAYSEQLYRRT